MWIEYKVETGSYYGRVTLIAPQFYEIEVERGHGIYAKIVRGEITRVMKGKDRVMSKSEVIKRKLSET